MSDFMKKMAEQYRNSASYRTEEQIEADYQAKLERIAADRTAFEAKANAHYAELKEKSQSVPWQRYASDIISQYDLGQIYAAIRCFSSSPYEGEGHLLVESGLAERHSVNGENRYLLTERGYMIVWARGTGYYPGEKMAGL